MEENDKNEILEAIKTSVAQSEERIKTEMVEAIGAFAGSVDERFERIEDRIRETKMEIKGDVAAVDGRVRESSKNIGAIDSKLEKIESDLRDSVKHFDNYLTKGARGEDHITHTRKEYDTLADVAGYPNRFAEKKGA